jgi:hypothetical protein
VSIAAGACVSGLFATFATSTGSVTGASRVLGMEPLRAKARISFGAAGRALPGTGR